ncbi:MAG: transporter substrate-binding domain-containing protein, partial [Phycisphaerae bacterium]|nr:transporter substrate-binding domain-containing protein [Phycisphaerae bacterium]
MESIKLGKVIALTLLAATFLLAGCSSSPSQSGEVESTLEKVKTAGKVIIGIGQEAAPFGYMQDGELVGFDVDIANAVVQRLKEYAGKDLALEFRAVSDETRISWAQSGEVHMTLCHTNITRKR